MHSFGLSLIYLFLLSSKAFAFSEATFTIESDTFNLQQLNDYSLGNFPELLSEDEVIAQVNQGKFIKKEVFELKYNQYFYFGYRIDNRLSKPQYVFLKLPGYIIDSQIYTAKDGKLMPWLRYPLELDVFYSELPPGTTIVIGHRKSGANITGRANGVKIFNFRSLIPDLDFRTKEVYLVYGATLIMLFFNLGMFVVFRKSYFFYYMLYSIGAVTALYMYWGQEYFDSPQLSLRITVTSLSLIMFCRSALSVEKDQKILHRSFLSISVIVLVLGILSWVLVDFRLIFAAIPLSFLLCIYASLVGFLKGYRHALYLLMGWGIFCLSILLAYLNFTQFGSKYLNSISLYGFAAELCLFTFANSLKAQYTEKKALKENAHAFNQLEKVFYPHQISMMKNGVDLEQTMPTGKSQACVISFDIIGSTGIEYSRTKDFLEESLKSCLALVSVNYDPTTLEARAYRIKEVGDGFLCSVGFPFKIASGEKLEDAAVLLAYDFVREFEKTVIKHFGRPLVFCSMGIALDQLEGYFPRIGTVEYDVYGRAVVLANRYESERKILFPHGFDGHIIILQDKVHLGLSPHIQQDFIAVDLESKNMSVRDDITATQLAYRIIDPKN